MISLVHSHMSINICWMNNCINFVCSNLNTNLLTLNALNLKEFPTYWKWQEAHIYSRPSLQESYRPGLESQLYHIVPIYFCEFHNLLTLLQNGEMETNSHMVDVRLKSGHLKCPKQCSSPSKNSTYSNYSLHHHHHHWC